MEQFRQIGEVLGSMKALMVFRDNIQINHRQCSLLFDILCSAYDSIAEEMKHNLKFEEKNTKWKILEQPLRELHKIYKEGEVYIRQCLEINKDWWAKTIILFKNSDCVQFHIHNLLTCMPNVIEAIEIAGEISGWDHDDVQKKKLVNSSKYKKEYNEWKIFQWRFGKHYLITPDFCNRFDTVWKEDRWILFNKIQEMKISCSSKHDQQLIEILLKSLDGSEKLLTSSILLGSKDYMVRRRLGSEGQYKEIKWLGEGFASRHLYGDIESLNPEISSLLSLSHPNIIHFLCGFTDEEKKECFLIMELMSKHLCSYIKDMFGPKKRFPFSVPLAVDLMLQIARGMEYLHSKKIYHGNLNPSNILVRQRGISAEGSLLAKVAGFGLTSVKSFNPKSPSTPQNVNLPFIWHAPEVLEEQEQNGVAESSKYTEKADVYSFGMVCFQLLTGKVPFEDSHLQGDKMSRNIRAGERPLFPYHSPKYLTNLTKKCWHAEPNQRPSFSSICRILRNVKRFLTMNPEYNNELDPAQPMVDYCDMESVLLRNFPSWGNSNPSSIPRIPFEMFVCRFKERERTSASFKDTSESGSDASACGDEHVIALLDDPFPLPPERKPLASSFDGMKKKLPFLKKSSADAKTNKPVAPRGRSIRPPQIMPIRRMRTLSESQLIDINPRLRRTTSASDSELS